jgi:predicted permease
MESLLKDLQHSFRIFRQTPGFTATAVAALALGIGTNTAIFSVVNAVLLKPVHAPEPNRVVAFVSTSSEGSSPLASEIKFNLWREQTTIFEDVSGYYFASLNLTGVDQPQHAEATFITQDYFHLFGLSIAQGRTFTREEEQSNGPPAVVLSDAFWKRSFGGDPRIIGKPISLSGTRYEVIGVMAANAQTETPEPIDVWLSFPIDPNSNLQAHYFQALGRLKRGISLDAANARLQFTTQEFRRKFPNTLSTNRGDMFTVEPMQNVLVKDARSSLIILTGAVSLVLLIACANVANLFLARAAGRRREISIRLALGASRIRIIRKLLTESVLLSLAGGVFGLLLGIVGIHALLALNASHLPRIGMKGANVTMDWRVLAFTIVVALATGLLFGLIPALQGSRTDLNPSLKESGGRTGTGFRQNRARSLLVIGEMSLALLLLIGAALLIRTLIALRSVTPGFDPQNVVTTRTPLEPASAKKSGVDQIIRDVFRRVSPLPGVESVGYTRLLPLEGDFNSIPIIVVGRPLNGPSHETGRWMVISSSYFDVLRIPLLRGRSFTDADRLDSPGVAIINQTMARRLWPNGDPLNAQLFIGKGLGPGFAEPARQIVGIVGDVHDNALSEHPQPAVFVPGAQLPDTRTAGRAVAWVIRTRGHSPFLNSAITNELRQATGEPVPPIRSMGEIILQSTARQNFNTLLMGIFGGSALLLAVIGIYGLMSYTVQQRTQEIGIRIALGAQSGNVRNMVVLQGMGLAVAGVVIGVATAFGLTRFLATFLFGVRALDPLVFILVPILLGCVALIAVWLPAHRASHIDPIVALRYE